MGLFGTIGTAIGAYFGGPGGAAIGAGLGSAIDGEQTNRSNKRIAQSQMKFQAEMSNTAHQREVEDLQKAGLNPVLSAGGNGSSTPSGASATMETPTIQMPDMFSVGMSLKQLEQADQKIAIDKANSAAAIAKSLDERDLIKMKKVLSQKGMLRAEAEGEAAQLFSKFMKYIKGSHNQNNPLSNPNTDKKSFGPMSAPQP